MIKTITWLIAFAVFSVFSLANVQAGPRKVVNEQSMQNITYDYSAKKKARYKKRVRLSAANSDYSYGEGRPAGCPYAWCGCWLSLEKFGENRRHLWVARNWLHEGSPASAGCIGCVAILSRGRGGHVGIVIGYNGRNPIIRSGNHNRSVGTAEYPVRRVIGYRNV